MPNFGPVEIDTIVLDGGLDQVTPLSRLPGGVAREALNFEVSTTGGFTTVQGYERFDGRPHPSEAQWATIAVSTVAGIVVGDSVYSLTTGASGVVAVVDAVLVELTLTKVVGVFNAPNQFFKVGVIPPIGTIVANTSADLTIRTEAQRAYAAAEIYRADILPVPGVGPVWVARLKNKVYAFRNNSLNTRKTCYVQSGTGWTQITLGNEIYFITGVNEIFEGDTVTDLSTGATMVVGRVVLQGGTWGTDAAGKLIITSHVGAAGPGHALQVGGVTMATSTTSLRGIDLAPGGQMVFDVATFGGAFNGQRIYGCDGVGRAFEFDGSVLAPIDSGMGVLDSPQCLAVFKNALFLAFGSSVQFSGIGAPYIWAPLFGAGEIAMNADVTNMIVQQGDQTSGSMTIYSQNNIAILYGNTSADFKLSVYDQATGAEFNTVQSLGDQIGLDARGLIKLTASLNYGNFDQDTLTAPILPFVKEHRGRSTCSCISRDKAQYRVFYSDGYAIYATIVNGVVKGCMPVWTPSAFVSAVSGEQNSAIDAIYLGAATDGYVYRLDAGTSFDGAAIPFNLLLTYSSEGNARLLKRYRKAALEIVAAGFAKLNIGFDFSYSDPTQRAMQTPVTFNKNPLTPMWDSGTWDSQVWDGRALGPIEVPMTGTSENVAMRVIGQNTFSVPFTVNSVYIHWSPRRNLR